MAANERHAVLFPKGDSMKVSECMSTDVRVASPKQTIAEAAGMMSECDSGILPVGENDRLVGMVTDRDIVIRAVARNLGPTTAIRDVMSNDQVLYCFEDDDVADVAENLAEQQVRRLPVLNREKRLVGIISLGDIAKAAKRQAGTAVAGITRRGGKHDQTQH
jgi:CBS domain-containing protein